MSLNTAAMAANDPDLQLRVTASVYSEAIANPDLKETQFAANVRLGVVNLTGMFWAVGDAVDQQYEAGVLAGRGSPGHDPDVVTDGAITSAVVANWPEDAGPILP